MTTTKPTTSVLLSVLLSIAGVSASCSDDPHSGEPFPGADAGPDSRVDGGCDSESESDSGADAAAATAASNAIAHFYEVYHGNRYGEIGAVQTDLRAAIALNPEDAHLYALLAGTHFWHVGESERETMPDPNILRGDMPKAVEYFQRAFAIDTASPGGPKDHRLPGYAGVTTVHLGQVTGNADTRAEGERLLAIGLARYPEFNSFNLWASYNGEPKDSPDYQRALESLFKGLEACIGQLLDRDNPDMTPYMNQETGEGPKRVCWSKNTIAPHAFEGFLVNLGNGLVKANRISAARVAYRSAKLASNYASWPYRAAFERVEASDLEARAALYADADPTNDPPVTVAGRSCVYCHATSAEP